MTASSRFLKIMTSHYFVFLQTAELSSKANLSITNMSSICHLKVLIIPKRRFDILKQMASVNGCIAPCRKSSTPLHLGKNCTTTWNFFKRILIIGWSTTTTNALIVEGIALEKHLCRHLVNHYLWLRIKC